MRELTTKLEGGREEGGATPRTLTLTFDERTRSRQRVRLDDGEEMSLLLPRGTVLRGGDQLRASDGEVVQVQARAETLSSVDSDDPLTLARAAYHLGNRHIAVEVARQHLRYQHDHVLDDMVRALGLTVRTVEAPFEPEAGAYGGGHGHGHGHRESESAVGHTHAHHPSTHPHPADHPHARRPSR